MTHAILEAKGLNKTFVMHLLGGRRISALKDISLRVEEGEFVALVGRTGAGKSSLVKSLLQIYRPDSGSVHFRRADGMTVDLTILPQTELLDLLDAEIGYVSQHLRVVPRVGALDLMLERASGEDPEAARAAARSLFAQLGLPPDLEDVFPVTFSGGEKQRLNLALTLMRQPRLLFLDEPTAALDPATRDRIVEFLAMRKRDGVTTIGIFHDLDAVAKLADRVIEVDGGRLVAERRTAAPAMQA